jgi:hypothetical protein
MKFNINNISQYPENGCVEFGQILDESQCLRLREWINKKRPVSQDIFYKTKEAFEKKGRWTNYAPGRESHNLLLDPTLDLSFIEKNNKFIELMEQLCGENYHIFKKSIIRSTPLWAVPSWVSDYVIDVGRPNLNPFVLDEFQDVQYFLCTDFHQDKTRPDSDFATVYIYLDDVDPNYSALKILVGSHKLGMTVYPHSLRRSLKNHDMWFYSDNIGNHMECPAKTVTGVTGSISAFHCMTIHGTGFNQSKNPRISLRYLVMQDPQTLVKRSLQSQANQKIIGPMKLLHTRNDVGIDNSFIKTGSSLHAHEDVNF